MPEKNEMIVTGEYVKSYYKLWVPEIISIMMLILSIYFKLDISGYDYKFIFSNCVCFVSIIAGSLITMSSILVTSSNEKHLKTIRLLDPDNMIGYYLGSPVTSGIVLSIISIVGALLIDSTLHVSAPDPLMRGMIRMNCVYITSLWLMLTVYFLYSSMRSVYINIEILKILYEPKISGGDGNVDGNIEKICEMISEE